MKIIEYVSSSLGQMCKQSKRLLKCGCLLTLSLALTAAALYISAGRLTDYYPAVSLAQQLMQCINPCIGVIALGIFLFEGTQIKGT